MFRFRPPPHLVVIHVLNKFNYWFLPKSFGSVSSQSDEELFFFFFVKEKLKRTSFLRRWKTEDFQLNLNEKKVRSIHLKT